MRRGDGETGRRGERGFAMLLVFLMAAVIAISLYIELPRVAFEAQRNKEELLIERGEQYKRAIQVFFKKNRRYPGTIEELENFNGVRSLRRRYVDPMTGKSEWRIIHMGPGGVLTDSLVHKQSDKDKKEENRNTFITEGPVMGAPVQQQGPLSPALRRRASEGGLDPGVPGQPALPGQPYAPMPGQPQPPMPGQPQVYPTPTVPYGMPGQPGTAGPVPPQPYPQVPGQPVPLGQPFPMPLPQQQPGQTMPPAPPGFPTPVVQPGQPGYPAQPGYPQQPTPVWGYPGPPVSSQTGGVSPYPYSTQPGAQGPRPAFPQPGMQPSGRGVAGSSMPAPGSVPQMIMGMLTNPAQNRMQGGTPMGGMQIGGGIAGVASLSEQEGIKIYNERDKYNEWEFIYDYSKDRGPAQATGATVGTPGSQKSPQTGQPPQSPFFQPGFGPPQPSFGTFGQSAPAPTQQRGK